MCRLELLNSLDVLIKEIWKTVESRLQNDVKKSDNYKSVVGSLLLQSLTLVTPDLNCITGENGGTGITQSFTPTIPHREVGASSILATQHSLEKYICYLSY
jgi:6-pyruvoyl-tetrahydropterin synthase